MNEIITEIRKHIEPLLHHLQKRHLVFAVAAILGFAPLSLSIASGLIPALQATKAAEEQLELLRTQEAMLRASPAPEAFRAEAAAEWLKKVPAEEDHAELLANLLALESSSGVELEAFQFSEDEKSVDEMIQNLERLKTSANETMAELSGTAEAGVETGEDSAEPSAPLKSEGIAAESLSLEVTGDYGGVVSFWKGFASLERLATVTTWSLSAEAEAKVRLRLEANIFTATSFPELKAIRKQTDVAPAVGGRADPTLTDEAFYNQLEELQEKER